MNYITLRGVHPEVRLARSVVLFAFPDGKLAYDCVRCGSLCCRGHGYQLQNGEELVAQLQLRPSVRIFLSSTVAPSGESTLTHHVANCTPGCYFLEENG